MSKIKKKTMVHQVSLIQLQTQLLLKMNRELLEVIEEIEVEIKEGVIILNEAFSREVVDKVKIIIKDKTKIGEIKIVRHSVIHLIAIIINKDVVVDNGMKKTKIAIVMITKLIITTIVVVIKSMIKTQLMTRLTYRRRINNKMISKKLLITDQ
jgi:hypothetical protein